jgi:hypothetical protein
MTRPPSPSLLSFLLSFLFSVSVLAQEPLEFRGYALGGLCTSQIHGDGVSGFNKFGVTGGFGLEIGRKGTSKSISGSLLYTQKGSRRVPNPKAGDYTTWSYRFTYIDIPILRQWQFATGWWLGVGLQPSVLLSGEENFNQTGYAPTTIDLKPLDIGGIVSGGLEMGDHWDLEARLGQSLLPISPQPESAIVRFDNFLTNMTLQIAARLRFG